MKPFLFIFSLRTGKIGHSSRLAALLFAFLAVFGWASLGAAPLKLNLANSWSNLELTWTNESDVRLQTSLTLSGDWTDLPDAVSPYQTPIIQPKVFFRLRRVPVIQSVEPAFLPAAGGTIYLAGRNFTANTSLLLNGVPAGSVTFVDSSRLMVNVGPLATGVYTVSLTNYGPSNVLANALTVNATGTSDEAPPGMAATALGEFRESTVDLAIPAPIGPGFVLARTYRSRFGPANSPLGKGWDFSANIAVETSGNDVIIRDGDGRADKFFRQSDGTYTRPEFFREGTVSGQTFTLTFADKGRWVFRPFNAASAPGKIAQSIDRNGNTMTYTYNGTGQLTTVTDALNRAVQFAYNGSGLLTSVTDFAGRVVTYTYDGNGNLATMTTPAVTGTPNGNDFPSGKTITYTYTSGNADQNLNHNLTGIIDNTGTVVMTNQYSTGTTPGALNYDRLVSSALGANPATVFSYEAQTPAPGNRYATTQVYVNDPVGNVATALFDSRNRPVQTRQLTGRAIPGLAVSAVGNQPTGKLRESDPAYFETTATYNLDSLPVQITEPRGNSMAMVYAGDANPATPVRERGNLLTVTQTPAPGVPSDQAQRVEQFEYLPGFGTEESGPGWIPDSMMCKVHRVIGDLPHIEVFKVQRVIGNVHSIDTFHTKHTDPRGNVWNYGYDANGNRTSVSPPGLATGHNFEYNAAGQLTAHVAPADANARRQRDTFSYYGSGAQQGYLQSAVTDANGLALTTSYAYDAVGNVTSVTDPRGNDTQFVYNQLNQLMRAKSPPGAGGVRTETSLTYSSQNGGLSYFGAVGGNVLIDSDTFDGAKVYGGGSSQNGGLSYFGVVSGNVLIDSDTFDGAKVYGGGSSADDVVSHEWGHAYTTDSCFSADDVISHEWGHALDQYTGNLIYKVVSNTDENGNPIGDGQLSTIYGRDSIGRLTSVTNEVSDASSTVTQYAYDANGQVTSVLSPLAVSGADAFNTVATRYDERGLPFQQTAAPGSPAQSTTQYAYDANANLAAITEGLEGTPRVTTVVADGFAGYLGYPFLYLPRGQLSSCNGFASSGGKCYGILWDGTQMTQSTMTDSIIAGGTGTGPVTSDPSSLSTRTGVAGLYIHVVSTSSSEALATPGGGTGTVSMEDGLYDDLWTGEPLSIVNGGTEASMMWNGKPLSVSHGGTGVSSFRPAKITDPMGNVTEFHYDASGNCSSVRQDGEVNDVPGSVGNVKLAEASFNYDALNRLIGQTNLLLNASGNTTGSVTASAAFADNGTTTAVTDALGRVITVAYDTAGRVSSVTDPKGNSTAYAYDANGNVTGVTNTMKSDLGNADLVLATTYTYDSQVAVFLDRARNHREFEVEIGSVSRVANRCTSATDSAGNTVSCAYDSLGNVVKTTDARGIVSQFEYDGLGRLTRSGRDMNNNGSTLDPVDIVTTQSWDANSRLTSQTDPNGNATSYGYDSLDRLTQTLAADGTANPATYDVHGNVVSSTDANGTVTTCNYDLNNRLLQKTILPALGVAPTTSLETFAYDGLGRVTQATNNGSNTSFNYDSLGRTLTETQNGLTVTSTYDAAGNRLTVAYPGGRTIGYAYDAANLPTTVSLLASSDGETPGVLSTNRYIGGQLERVDNRNNTRTSYSYNGVAGTANALGDFGWGQISRVQTVNFTSGAVIDDTTYRYDAAQNQTGKITSFPGKVTAKAYQFDAADRLVNTVVTTNAVPTANITYTLDKAGNRLNVTGDNHPGAYTLNNTLPEPADFQVNQYSTTPVGNFSYDKNGNRIAETSGATTLRTFSYDYANRLVAVNNGSTGAPIAGYGYDALGRRILKGTQSGATSNTTRYVYDGDEVIEERDGNGNVVACVIYNIVSVRRPNHRTHANMSVRRNGTNYWPSTDAAGSVVALTRDNGTVAERYDYADFGEPAFFDGEGNPLLNNATGQPATQSAVGNPYLWGGMEYDEETGFYLTTSSTIRYVELSVVNDPGRIIDPRAGTTLQRDSGSSGNIILLIQTRSAGKTSGGDGMRLD